MSQRCSCQVWLPDILMALRLTSFQTASLPSYMPSKHTRLALFDVDGTVTPPRGVAAPSTMATLRQLRAKLCWQLGSQVSEDFDYVFAECGLIAYKRGLKLPHERFVDLIGEDRYKNLVNFILRYIADLDIPIKRGTFVEFRDGLINVCPQGRNTTTQEQDMFDEYDKASCCVPSYNLVCAIGGRTSFDVFPRGWDKTYALRHLEGEGYSEIHYFGDKTHEGGNDFEIFHDPRIIGHTVDRPEDTGRQIEDLFLKEKQFGGGPT
ncbi:eukaryotic phosphomannomutase [Fomitopsis serialis]|uniref:eukaryotic phosphomannomutase n=1 Tax=Fomitopsis serialis TaxID=139415 RepID=UPI002007998D|nr:eukaryotic phosphomannomutase [Neoantrodia serialis]KAH9913302.1 eukaryotic phosphomannomutase [Neoantrodia serialis]